VASAAIKSGACDRVAWVPAFAPPHKREHWRASFADRSAMVELTIGDRGHMFLSRIEEELGLVPSYTIDILEAWERRTGDIPALLIGADSLRELHTWHRADELVRKYRIISYPRGGTPVTAEELQERWPVERTRKLLSGIISGDFFEISSSEIKKRMEKITAGGDIIDMKGYLADGVLEYIIRHGLYRSSRERM